MLEGCLKFFVISFVASIILFTVWIHLGGGIYFCGGFSEHSSLRYLTLHGRAGSALDITEVVAEMEPRHDCDTIGQFKAVFHICSRNPEHKRKVVDYAMEKILDEETPHFNRIQLIRVVETITTKTFEESCYPFKGWSQDKIPEHALPYIEFGIDNIRKWWESGNITYRDAYEVRSFGEDMLWVIPGYEWKPSAKCEKSLAEWNNHKED